MQTLIANGLNTNDRPKTKQMLCLFCLCLISGIGLRVVSVAAKTAYSHDEVISYMAATGHQGAYAAVYNEQVPPYNTWQPVSTWARFIDVEDQYCFRTIGKDLAETDIHPPLYFWLLHLFCLAFGSHVWSGVLLNSIIDLFTTLLIYRLARFVFNDFQLAGWAALFWLFSPAVVNCAINEARQYSLLAFCGVGFAFFFARLIDERVKPSYSCVAGVTGFAALGALTHYYFGVLVAGGVVWASCHMFKQNKKRLSFALASCVAAYLIFLVAHPMFYLSFAEQQHQRPEFSIGDLPDRLLSIVHSFVSYFCKYRGLGIRPMIAILIFAVGIGLVVRLKTRYHIRGLSVRKHNGVNCNLRFQFMVFWGGWTSGAITVLYLLALVPAHAMGDRYLALFWPFFSIAVVTLPELLPKVRRGMLVGVLVLLVLSSTEFSIRNWSKSNAVNLRSIAASADKVVLTNAARGVLPAVIYQLSGDTTVYVAEGEMLIDESPRWLKELEQGDLVISKVGYRATAAIERRVLALVERRWSLDQVAQFSSLGTIYRISSRVSN